MSQLLETARKLHPPLAASVGRSLAPVAVVAAVGVLLQYLVGPMIGDYPTIMLTTIGINIMLAVSLNMVNGFTGQFSIGHAGFMAVGGYVAAAISYYGSLRLFGNAGVQPGLITTGSLLFAGSCLIGGLAAAFAGYLVGLPSLRLRGDYLAIVTLGFGEIVRVLIQQTGDVVQNAEQASATPAWELATSLGGALGFGGVPWYNNLFWTSLFCGLTLLVCYRLKRSSTGRAFLSVREDEVAAQAMGVDITQTKVRAFVISSFLAGVAGGVFAHQSGVILNAGELNFAKSFDILIMVVLGGLGSISGATLAAIILTILSEALRQPPHVWPYMLGIVAIAAVLTLLRRDITPEAKSSSLRRMAVIAVLVTGVLELIRWQAAEHRIDLAGYRMVIYAMALILMMILRPGGLFGVHEVWDAAGAFRRGHGSSAHRKAPQ